MAMSDDDKLDMALTMMGMLDADNSETDRVAAYLTAAEKEILSWRYSYSGRNVTSVPEEYEMTQVFAVVAGYSQSGAENQTSHSENGIARTFKYADMMAYIRQNVVPYAGLI